MTLLARTLARHPHLHVIVDALPDHGLIDLDEIPRQMPGAFGLSPPAWSEKVQQDPRNVRRCARDRVVVTRLGAISYICATVLRLSGPLLNEALGHAPRQVA